MILTSVLSHGRVALGPDAAAVGFVEGAIITIVVLSTGSVLIRLDDEPAIEEGTVPCPERAEFTLSGPERACEPREGVEWESMDDEGLDDAATLAGP